MGLPGFACDRLTIGSSHNDYDLAFKITTAIPITIVAPAATNTARKSVSVLRAFGAQELRRDAMHCPYPFPQMFLNRPGASSVARRGADRAMAEVSLQRSGIERHACGYLLAK